VKEEDLIASFRERTAEKVKGGHVLALQDTTEFNFLWNKNRKKPGSGLGVCTNTHSLGFMVHPTLAINADTSEVYGFSHIRVWHREGDTGTKYERDYKRLPVDKKESNKWLESSIKSRLSLQKADMVTIIEDREGDIYKQFCDAPRGTVHLLVRNSQNRRLDNGKKLHAHLKELPVQGMYDLDVVQSTPSGYRKRKAPMQIRFDRVTLLKPARLRDESPERVSLSVVEVSEVNPPESSQQVNWKLLTTHPVNSVADALQIVGWYSQRWYIEQLFRLLKRKGFQLERSELESGWAIRKLTIMAMQSALTILQLKFALQQREQMPAKQRFSSGQIKCLRLLNKKYQGKTEKQKNPYNPDTLAWAAWIIARIGGWKAYQSQRPPGLITLKEGMDRFDDIFKGFMIFMDDEDVCTP